MSVGNLYMKWRIPLLFIMVLSQEGKRRGSIVRDQFKEKVEDLILNWDQVDIKPK
jgi:hypothetical protein